MSCSLHRHLYRAVRSEFLQRIIPESAAADFPPDRPGIEVIGLFSTPSGLGESARLCAAALERNGLPVLCRDVTHVFRKRPEVEWRPGSACSDEEIGVRLFHLNPPMLPPAILAIGLKNFSRTCNIGYWAWELSKLPKEWQRALRYMNAIFVPSRFTRAAIARYTAKPVIVIPHPVSVAARRPNIRAALGIPNDAFVASTVFNFSSSFERKNPVAGVRAFVSGLADKNNAFLILKTSGGQAHSAEKEKLRAVIGDTPRMMIVDEVWTAERVHGLLAHSDVVISLHRSEGFGLTIAEAMRLETPVIATAWSGNLDFCHSVCDHLVPATLTKLNGHAGVEFGGLANATWAEPDIEHAAQALRWIYQNPIAATRRARISARNLDRYLSSNTYLSALQTLRGDIRHREAVPRTAAAIQQTKHQPPDRTARTSSRKRASRAFDCARTSSSRPIR